MSAWKLKGPMAAPMHRGSVTACQTRNQNIPAVQVSAASAARWSVLVKPPVLFVVRRSSNRRRNPCRHTSATH